MNRDDELTQDEQLDLFNELIAYFRWYPDVFLECITPHDEDGNRQGITLGSDQKLILRALCRFPYTHIVLPRGFGKTLLELLSLFISAILTPDLTISMSAQTLQASAGMIQDKLAEVKKFYPIIADEIVVEQISRDRVYIEFKSGSKITNLENRQSAKGKRRNLVFLEECALMDETTYRDALEPLVSEPYKNIKDFTHDVFIKNRQSFITTAYMKNEAYDRNVKMFKDMVNLDRTFCLGADYRLPSAYGRGRSAEQIEALEEKVGKTFFKTNYCSRWLGVNENCIVDINKLESLRTILKAELRSDGKSEYLMGVDVARSSKSSNNQTSIMIGKIKRDKKGKVNRVQIVYTTNLPQGLNFSQQSLYIKKLKNKFDIKTVVVDANGLGIGLVDELVKPTVDQATGEEFVAFDTINMDIESDEMDSEPCVYGLKAQGIQSEIIVNFMNYIEMGKVQLLSRIDHNNIDASGDFMTNEQLPHLHTGFLVEEVGNVSVKTLSNGKLGIEQNTKGIDKDRLSALMYLLYYIEKYENQVQQKQTDVSGYLIFRQSRYK